MADNTGLGQDMATLGREFHPWVTRGPPEHHPLLNCFQG